MAVPIAGAIARAVAVRTVASGSKGMGEVSLGMDKVKKAGIGVKIDMRDLEKAIKRLSPTRKEILKAHNSELSRTGKGIVAAMGKRLKVKTGLGPKDIKKRIFLDWSRKKQGTLVLSVSRKSGRVSAVRFKFKDKRDGSATVFTGGKGFKFSRRKVFVVHGRYNSEVPTVQGPGGRFRWVLSPVRVDEAFAKVAPSVKREAVRKHASKMLTRLDRAMKKKAGVK